MPVEIDHSIGQREFFPHIAKGITRISHLAVRSGSEWCEFGHALSAMAAAWVAMAAIACK
jgi:hypothetical protein